MYEKAKVTSACSSLGNDSAASQSGRQEVSISAIAAVPSEKRVGIICFRSATLLLPRTGRACGDGLGTLKNTRCGQSDA